MAAPWITIKDMPQHVEEEVSIRGWMYNKRSSGKIHFLQIRDGSGFVQAVMVKKEVSPEEFEAAKKLWMEASVEITGTVRSDDRAPSGVELTVSNIKVNHNPTDEYPIGKKDHGVDFLLDNRHLWLRSQRQRAIMTIRERIVWSWRQFLHDRDFLLVDSPIITGAIGEGASVSSNWTTSTRRPTWPRRDSCTLRRRQLLTARSIASAPPSGRKNPRQGGTSPSSGCWSPRWPTTTIRTTWTFRKPW